LEKYEKIKKKQYYYYEKKRVELGLKRVKSPARRLFSRAIIHHLKEKKEKKPEIIHKKRRERCSEKSKIKSKGYMYYFFPFFLFFPFL